MKWFLSAIALAGMAYCLRRLLHMGGKRRAPLGMAPLPEPLQAIYRLVAQEIETNSAIVGISLNDAFEERDGQRAEQAWRMMRLSSGEWDRLAALNAAVLNVLTRYLARPASLVPPNGILAHWFKTRTMVDFVRMHELFSQLVINSRIRFQLQLRLLRRATAALTGEFRYTLRNAERIEDPSPEVWAQFDCYFHDFDLVMKETLLALRALLVCLDPSTLPEFSAELEGALHPEVRASAALIKR